MLATILYRLAGTPKTNTSYFFNDVKFNAYYRDAIDWADSRGIANGASDWTFSPDSAVSREQLATMLYRYAVLYEGMDGQISINLNKFSDANSISSYAKKAMEWCVEKGLIAGKGNNVLDPKGTATRAEISAILLRFSQLPDRKGVGYKDVVERIINESANLKTSLHAAEGVERSSYYDVDGDGSEELFIIYTSPSDSQWLEQVVSLYSKNDESIIPIMEKEVMHVPAGGGGGDFGVAEKDGHTYVMLTHHRSHHYDIGTYLDDGFWKLYDFKSNGCSLKTAIDYRIVHKNNYEILEDKSTITKDGFPMNVNDFKSWEKSLKLKLKLHAYI